MSLLTTAKSPNYCSQTEEVPVKKIYSISCFLSFQKIPKTIRWHERTYIESETVVRLFLLLIY